MHRGCLCASTVATPPTPATVALGGRQELPSRYLRGGGRRRTHASNCTLWPLQLLRRRTAARPTYLRPERVPLVNARRAAEPLERVHNARIEPADLELLHLRLCLTCDARVGM